jgi:hypothetical protein
MGMLGKLIPTIVKGAKMVQSGSSDQEAKSFMESQGLRNVSITRSTPTVVDVIAKKKTLTRGTGVTYSNIKTSSQGLLNSANVKNKTLLGE